MTRINRIADGNSLHRVVGPCEESVSARTYRPTPRRWHLSFVREDYAGDGREGDVSDSRDALLVQSASKHLRRRDSHPRQRRIHRSAHESSNKAEPGRRSPPNQDSQGFVIVTSHHLCKREVRAVAHSTSGAGVLLRAGCDA